MSERKTILLVEDDRVDVMTVRRAFRQLKLDRELVVMGDGRSALEYLETLEVPQLPWLILLDLNMPRMNGIEFLQHRRSQPWLRRVPVIVLTTSSEDQDRIESYDLCIAGYVIKPLSYDKFVEVIQTINAYWVLSKTSV